MQLFVFKNNQKTGPFTLEQVQANLKAGLLSTADLCWYDGLPNWTPLSSIPESAPATDSPGSSGPPPIAVLPPSRPPPPPEPVAPALPKREVGESLGMLMVIIPVVAASLTWFWIGNMRLIDGPGAKLGFLTAAAVLSTALLAAIEAGSLGFGKDASRSSYERVSPPNWFFSLVLLWVIYYPVYLYMRSRYGVRNLVGWGLLSMILWLVPLAVVSYHILNAEEHLDRQIQQLQNYR